MPPGERKSGIPDSVEIPAPVNTTARRALLSNPASSAISESTPAGPVSSGLARLHGAAIRLHPIALEGRRGIHLGSMHHALETVGAGIMLRAGIGDLHMPGAFHFAIADHFGGHSGPGLAE